MARAGVVDESLEAVLTANDKVRPGRLGLIVTRWMRHPT